MNVMSEWVLKNSPASYIYIYIYRYRCIYIYIYIYIYRGVCGGGGGNSIRQKGEYSHLNFLQLKNRPLYRFTDTYSVQN